MRGLITCPRAHTGKIGGLWIRGADTELGLLIQSNGAIKFRARCRKCGQESSDLPNHVAADWRRKDNIEWLRKMQPNEYPSCSYYGCEREGREDHHFAPVNTFGDEANSWPILPLCQPHHTEWHTRMDGYRWRRPRPAHFVIHDGGCEGCGATFAKGHQCFCEVVA